MSKKLTLAVSYHFCSICTAVDCGGDSLSRTLYVSSLFVSPPVTKMIREGIVCDKHTWSFHIALDPASNCLYKLIAGLVASHCQEK